MAAIRFRLPSSAAAAIAGRISRGINSTSSFDAFATLFHPNKPPDEQYYEEALKFGGFASHLAKDKLRGPMIEALKAESKARPNYGYGMESYGGPEEWWGNVVKGTLERANEEFYAQKSGKVQSDLSEGDSHDIAKESQKLKIPPGFLDSVWKRFATKEAYDLYEDVGPFFEQMRDIRRRLRSGGSGGDDFHGVVVGVTSNFDYRLPQVLSALGLKVGRATAFTGHDGAGDGEDRDIDFVVTSYETGFVKPQRGIYDASRDVAQRLLRSQRQNGDLSDEGADVEGQSHLDITYLHVGDDYRKDYQGAVDAGWQSCLLLREIDHGPFNKEVMDKLPESTNVVTDLTQLWPLIEKLRK